MATILDIPQEVSAAPAPAQAQGTAVGGGGGAGAAAAEGTATVGEPGGGSAGAPAAAQGTDLAATVGEPSGGGSAGAPAAAQGTDLAATVGAGGGGAGALAAAGVTDDDTLVAEKKWIEDKRASLRVWCVLAAGAAYTSGIKPPMGTWQDDSGQRYGHKAGDPVMLWKAPLSYYLFKKSIDIAFALSCILLFMLAHKSFYGTKQRMRALKTVCLFDLLAFVFSCVIGSNPRFLISNTLVNLGLGFGLCVLVYLAFLTSDVIKKKWLSKKKKKANRSE